MATLKSFLCLLLLSVSVHCSPETLIPFIAWSNGDVLSSLSSKQPSTVDEFLGGANLKDIDLFVIFKTSKLSFDDIAKYGGVYGEKHSALSTLQSQLQSSQSTLWTGMQGRPAAILTSSLTFNYDVDPQDVLGADDISPSRDGKQLIVVLLPDDDSGERAFLEQGKVISEVMSAITSSQKSFIAFYTSDSSLSSGPQIQVFEHKRQAENRFDENFFYESDSSSSSDTVCALVRTNTTAGVIEPCAMMCLTTPFFMVNLTQSGSIGRVLKRAEDFEFGNGVCVDNGTNAYINITFQFVNDTEPPMTFQFSLLQGSHQVQDLNITVPNGFWTIVLENDNEVYIRNTLGMIYSRFEVPIGASYTCGKNNHNIFKIYRENSNSSKEVIGIQFSGLQAQIGGRFSETSFASAYNCESYLSHVSLMGIFSVLILLVILYCSTVFMFQMKTMDRFDDPRGPTISVENLH